ncbi:chemotaxis protein CheR [Stenotrophomonas sp. MYb57]|nr:chemotaxis protein CheR [Stenotrophomonas sp. MYb57]
MPAEARFQIVGIGASAGGVEALEGFFRGLPTDIDMAFVVVTHLNPSRKTLLPEILARFTSLPVVEAADGMPIERRSVYVMPENAVLGVDQGHFILHDLGGRREPKPVDIFLCELAESFESLAVGVILSGGDADGTLGLKAIQEKGGMTFAQVADGFGPQFPDMPNSAIELGFADFALPAEAMGPKIAELAGNIGMFDEAVQSAQLQHSSAQVAEQVAEIYRLLRTHVGHDFSGYKPRTFLRRVHRRMQVLGLRNLDAYVGVLSQEPQEAGLLFRDLLINVTNFFRDKDAFKSLGEQVIPQLLARGRPDDTIRIWVPGCATGEEVYSLAMLMLEHMAEVESAPRVQIFATDIDDRALAVARAARYPKPLLSAVSEERRRRFFLEDGENMVVSKQVRELCIFSPHSVIRDPPFSRIDMVSCRNLLIYFGPDVQAQVIPTFHYALRPDGFLFLGTAENLSQFDELFVAVDKRHRIFRRRKGSTPTVRLPMSLVLPRQQTIAEGSGRRIPVAGSLRHSAETQVLDRHAPAHVVVSSDGDIVYFSGRTGKYLEVPAGAPTRQLLTLARRELRLDLRTIFRDAVENVRSAHRGGLAIEVDDGRMQLVELVIEPLSERMGSEALFLVLFVDQGPILSKDEASNSVGQANLRADHLSLTERELHETRDRLQSLIEEYETALEDLKSSNEELVSVNEEMQSTNEELEASKEELQSVNEELHTVNAELHGKLEALDRANSDLVNLFQATEVATVFLDAQLAIRSFTPATESIFSIRSNDIGRPITDLSVRIELPHFNEDLQRALHERVTIERRASCRERGCNYLVRVGPYVDLSGRVNGVVVTFVDVTSLIRSEERQQVLIAELQHRTRNLLGIVQAIALRTLGNGENVADFAMRLAALGRAQSLLGGTLADEVDLAEMVRMELSSLGVPMERVSMSGHSVALSFDMAQTFSLALHELATNATKYGAFKVDGGQLRVHWEVLGTDGGRRLALRWRETGVPIQHEPQRSGFGTQLIVHAMSHTLNAETRLEYTNDGVFCSIEVPYQHAP